MIEGPLVIGGKKTPLYLKILADARRAAWVESMLHLFEARFGSVPPAIRSGLQQIKAAQTRILLTRVIAVCPHPQAFEDALRQELLNSRQSRVDAKPLS